MEPALRNAEHRLALLVDSGIIGVVVRQRDGTITEINDAALAMLGYARGEIVPGAVRWRDLTPCTANETDERVVAGALDEKDCRHKDGHAVPVRVASAMTDDADGEVISFVLDISERRRADAADAELRATRAALAQFRTLLESAPDAMVVVDGAGLIVVVNTQAEQLFGYSRDALLGRSIEVLVPERLRDKHPAHRAAYFGAPRAGATGAGFELFALRSDGTELPVEISLSPIETPEGILVASAIRDISGRRRTEVALADANKDLEAFSYSVAHDLRAPLRGMAGFARVLLDTYRERFDPEGVDWLEEILLNARKMSALIDALLSLGRVTRTELHAEQVDLSALATGIVARLAAADPERQVTVAITPGLHADVDPSLARALLQNLLENAWKFSAGSTTALIELSASDSHGLRTYFVRDNGAGFDMAYSDKLFTPFQRLHSEREFPGTGIGLATAKRIVHRHAGRIWAEGAVGRGATVFFTLPGSPTGASP